MNISKILIVGTIVLVLLGGFSLFFFRRSLSASSTKVVPTGSVSSSVPDKTSVKTFEVAGGAFYFKPNMLTVKEGDTVRIVFKNEGGMHDWALDEFNVRTPVIKSGESATVEFVANKVGTFEYYCSVGNHRAMGMVGKLVVAPK
jgi:plastocyanin